MKICDSITSFYIHRNLFNLSMLDLNVTISYEIHTTFRIAQKKILQITDETRS